MRGILFISTLILLTSSVWSLPTPDQPTVVEIKKTDEVILPVVKVESKEPEVVKVKVEPLKKVESTVLAKEPEVKETVVKSDVQPEVVKVVLQSDAVVKEEKPNATLLEVDSQGHENESDRVARQFGFGGFNPHGFGRYGPAYGGHRYGSSGYGRFGHDRYGFGGNRRYGGRVPYYG